MRRSGSSLRRVGRAQSYRRCLARRALRPHARGRHARHRQRSARRRCAPLGHGAAARCGLLIGALAGGDSLPALRAPLMPPPTWPSGGAAPHGHPRIEPGGARRPARRAGFAEPVVDVDRGRRCAMPRWTAWSPTCAPWARPTCLNARSPASSGRDWLRRGRRSFRGPADGRTAETHRNPPFPGWRLRRPTIVHAALTVYRGELLTDLV